MPFDVISPQTEFNNVFCNAEVKPSDRRLTCTNQPIQTNSISYTEGMVRSSAMVIARLHALHRLHGLHESNRLNRLDELNR
jgi:hypothetical protein